MAGGHARGTGVYWGGLDGIRAPMMLLVFLTHLPLQHWRGGFVGLDVFFCLSGFLITTLLCVDADKHGRVGIKRFYARRLVRLYPALLLGLVVAGVVVLFSTEYAARSFGWDAAAAVTYTSNFRLAIWTPISPIGQYWSLAVEEQFYILWAPLVMLVHRRYGLGKQALNLALGALGVYVVAKTLTLLALPAHDGVYAYVMLPGHADELLLGGVLALLVRVRHVRLQSPWPAAAAFVGLFLIAYKVADRPDRLATTVLWLGAACLGGVIVLHVTTADSFVTRLLSSPPLRWLGARSYAFYIFHVAVLHALMQHYGRRPLVVGPLGFAICVALTGLSWKYVEEPALRWRDRHRATRVGEVDKPPALVLPPEAQPAD
jgi:peptidoglycan/LPS O-acetylase OafA/YrhL